MTDDELKLARKLVDAASPGPWTVNEGGIIGSACPVIFGVLVGNDPNPYTYVCTDDSNFICASRTLVPALLDEIDRLRAERDAMRSVAEAAGKWSDDEGEHLSEGGPPCCELFRAVDQWRKQERK